MTRADITSPRRTKVGVAVFVVLIHIFLIFVLVQAFAPHIPGRALRQVNDALTVTMATSSPSPKPSPKDTQQAGTAGEAGRKAVPREMAAPQPKVALAETEPVPSTRSTGSADTSGALDVGQGTGAGSQGTGTGSGREGQGQGAGAVAKAVKVAGDINSARDYRRATRDLRIGSEVIIALTVGTDGRVEYCRVHRPSRDPESDRITCRLAKDRFRFRPATDAAGNPVSSVYHWRQWWFDPGKKSD